MLSKLTDIYAVSGHERPMRDAIREFLPEWARTRVVVDTAGNLVLAMGPERDTAVFIAHMDEIGFLVTGIAHDGTVSLRTRGTFFPFQWEGQTALLHRDDDTFGIGMGYAKVSGSASALDGATAAYTGAFVPKRGGETFVEMTYQYQATPWWQIQPDIQYVFNPGGGVANPSAPSQRIKNELVLGLRTNVLF